MHTSTSAAAARRSLPLLALLALSLGLGFAAGAAAALHLPQAAPAVVAAADAGVPGVWLPGRTSVPAASDVALPDAGTPAAPTF